MDSEEKELLKKLLSKIENLEKEVKEIKEGSKIPKLPPMPKTNDKLARALVKKAREKVIREAVEGVPRNRTSSGRNYRTEKERIQEIRDNFDLGEIALFALKKGLIKKGRPDRETKTVSIQG